MSLTPTRRLHLLAGVLALLTACAEDTTESPRSDAKADKTSEAAYVIGLRVDSPEDRFIYFGAFPEVPSSEPDRTKMIELTGKWQVTSAFGHVYSWDTETGEITSWAVADDLSLEKGDTLSFATQGLSGWRYHAFVAPDRAYTLGFESGVVAIWNPETMELIDELSFEIPGEFKGFDPYPLSVFVRGKQIIAPMYGDDFDTGEIIPRQIVAFIDTERDEVRFVTDDRCLPGGLGHITKDGDIYLDPYQSGTYFHLYGTKKDLAPPCELRIKSGEDRIDPDYVFDYSTVLGTHADGVWPISETEVMALAKLPGERLAADKAADEYWSQPCAAYKVDLNDGTHEAYTGLPKTLQMQSAGQHVVDNVSYYQNYSYGEDDMIDVVELGALTSDGWEKQFEIHGGDLWMIGRIR